MRILIITMDDPIHTNDFIKIIIDQRQKDIIAVVRSSRGRLAMPKDRSKVVYLLSLFLIMGPIHFSKNLIINLIHRGQISFSKIGLCKDPSITGYAKEIGLKVYNIESPNNKKFIETVKQMAPDLIINQSQYIIGKALLQIPKIGIINRHNALLPKNRGRLTPFWVLFKEETETGVSIHFLTDGIDNGPVIYQEKIRIESQETFNSLVKKNYVVAGRAIIKALELLEKGQPVLLPNDDRDATYNSLPTFREAVSYRIRRLRKIII